MIWAAIRARIIGLGIECDMMTTTRSLRAMIDAGLSSREGFDPIGIN